MVLTMQVATAVIEAAHRHAAERGAPSAVAVVDAGGNLLGFMAHEDAILAARDLATNKAFTALSLRASTADLTDAVQPGGPFYALNNALAGRPLVTFAGGLPLRDPETGTIVGAVGVSGGTLEDDSEISAAGLAAFAELGTGGTDG
ncbi:heme-binding protein [Nocardioides sp. NPDC092400]|uniref:GlcG/HbpS family heme-binding protein n=1 Tax=Nocardioides sp. NPDC092400 TaxID=3155196 RepID=UPI0034326494